MTLYARAVRALRAAGAELLDADDVKESFRVVLPARAVTGVVMTSVDTVAFWSAWPEPVPERRLTQVAELVTRANTELYSSALELDLDSGILAARCAVRCTALPETDDDLLAALLLDAAGEASRAATSHHSAVAAVVIGHEPAGALGLRL